MKNSHTLAYDYLNGNRTILLRQIEKQVALEKFKRTISKFPERFHVLRGIASLFLILRMLCLGF
jgi:hypothetical protein